MTEAVKVSKLIRVRKSDAKIEFIRKPDGLEICLDCWTSWLCSDPDRDLGVKTMRLPTGDADGYGRTTHEAQHEREMQIGAATDAMIESLSFLHRWAIYKLNGVASVWGFPNADLLIVGPAAQAALIDKLRRNVATSILF